MSDFKFLFHSCYTCMCYKTSYINYNETDRQGTLTNIKLQTFSKYFEAVFLCSVAILWRPCCSLFYPNRLFRRQSTRTCSEQSSSWFWRIRLLFQVFQTVNQMPAYLTYVLQMYNKKVFRYLLSVHFSNSSFCIFFIPVDNKGKTWRISGHPHFHYRSKLVKASLYLSLGGFYTEVSDVYTEAVLWRWTATIITSTAAVSAITSASRPWSSHCFSVVNLKTTKSLK